MSTVYNPDIQANPAVIGSPGDEKGEIFHSENQPVSSGSGFQDIQADAQLGETFEHELGLLNAIKLYRKAIFWAFIASLSIIMEGYDLALTGSYTALPVFRQYFGTYYPAIDQWQIPAQWQSALQVAGLCGNFIGIPFGGWLIERYGYRYALMGNYVLIMPFIAVSAFAKNLPMLFAGGFLQGIPFGVFSTLACGYASEVTPVKLRGYVTGWINICWVLGLLFGTGIANVIVDIKSIWGFRAGYMTQWIWPVPLFFFMWAAPDGPWWLVRQGRIEDAQHALSRLSSPSMRQHLPSLVRNMVRTNQLEADVSSGARWIDIFRGTDRRRTEIACMAFMAQSLCGDPFTGHTIYFLEQAGMSTKLAFLMGVINYLIVFFGCLIAYAAMTYFGRRTLYCWGLGVMTVGLVLIGGLQKIADHVNVNAKWGMAGVTITWNVWRVITIGPNCYSVVSESSSSRLRNKTIAMARISYQIVGLCSSFMQPWLINPSALNLKGYCGFVWAPICFVAFVWAYFRIPEFKDRSYYEIDVLFERRVPAKQFANTSVEALADDEIRAQKHISQHD